MMPYDFEQKVITEMDVLNMLDHEFKLKMSVAFLFFFIGHILIRFNKLPKKYCDTYFGAAFMLSGYFAVVLYFF